MHFTKLKQRFKNTLNRLNKEKRVKIDVQMDERFSSSKIGINVVVDNCNLGINTSIGANGYLFQSNVGDFSYLSSNVSIMNTKIGKFCSIAQGVCIGIGSHPSSTFVSTHPAFFSPHKQCGYSFTKQSHFKELGFNIIGNDVWVGCNAVILNDITIGDGAIIGAGAIVTKDVPPYAIVVGSPAKILRFRFNDDEIKTLMDFQWWDEPYSWIELNYQRFFNIKEFVDFIRSGKTDDNY